MTQPATSSGDLTAATGTTLVRTGAGHLTQLILFGGSAASTVIAYDSLTAAGTVLARFNVAAASTWSGEMDVVFNTGLTVVVTGTGAIANVHYIPS